MTDWSAENGAFVAEVPELAGGMGDGARKARPAQQETPRLCPGAVFRHTHQFPNPSNSRAPCLRVSVVKSPPPSALIIDP